MEAILRVGKFRGIGRFGGVVMGNGGRTKSSVGKRNSTEELW